MTDKSEFEKLPNVIKAKIADYLLTPDLLNVKITSKTTHNLFNTNKYLNPLTDTRKFLHHVVRGNHSKVVDMLILNPDLMRTRGQVIDLSGRTFTNISGFEYALWALDEHMWTKMLRCLPKTVEGNEIKAMLSNQYKKIKTTGVTYTLNGVTTTEKHFDLEATIIKELQTQVDNLDDKQWVTGVGGVQCLFPMHVVYEYCSDESFYPIPKFEKQPLQSSRHFYNWKTKKYESWFDVNSKLGKEFAIYKGPRVTERQIAASAGRGTEALHRVDLAAMRKLCEVRTKAFINLETELNPSNSFLELNGKHVVLNKQNELNLKLLLACASSPSLDKIQMLVNEGADLKLKSKDGSTCLFLLARAFTINPTLEIFKFFVDRGVDPGAKNKSGLTCLSSMQNSIFSKNHELVLKYLIEKGANPSDFSGSNIPSVFFGHGSYWTEDLQLSLILNFTKGTSCFTQTQNSTTLNKFEDCLRKAGDNREKLWNLFQNELYGMLSGSEKREFLTNNCKYFPKSIQEKVITFLLLLKHSPVFLLNNNRLKVPTFISLEIITESLGPEILPLLILKRSEEQLNHALESTMQKFDLKDQSQLNPN